MRKISPNVPKLSPHVRKKEFKKTKKKSKSVKKKPSRAEKRVQKDPKKNQNGLKNATIEIVAGHSEQNEPVFICLGREYRLVRKRPKKTSKWIEKRNDSDCCATFGTKTNRYKIMRP